VKKLTEDVKNKARELGFSEVGIAPVSALNAEAVHLKEWLKRGYHATMAWMDRSASKRTDPTVVLPGAQSVISVALNYYSPVPHSDREDVGKISRYAWGDDYHDVLDSKLRDLASFLQERVPECSTRHYVDTGPVMDKAWAVRAGIGWLGKHTNVITKNLGSWVFLGEIITTARFEYDAPIEDFCGTCTACIEACPTGAIVEPYVLDSGKCISYLTIEHRGDISGKLAAKFDNWVFGCDVCQDVCPWNRFQQPTSDRRFHPRPENVDPLLHETAHLTQEEFSNRFKHSPVKRTKLEGLVRNARVVLESYGK